jgi:Na+/melibiose symporter-like transporter
MAIALARILCIVFLSFLLNLFRKNPISWQWQTMLIFSGLRGAFAFALAIRNVSTHARSLMYTTTSIIVILTVVFNGTLVAPVLRMLKIRYEKKIDLLKFVLSKIFFFVRMNVNEEVPTTTSNDNYRIMENNNVRVLKCFFLLIRRIMRGEKRI